MRCTVVDSGDDTAGRVPGPAAGRPAPPADRDEPAAQDAAWVRAARSHDEQAFGRLFDRWFDPVYDVAWRIVRNRDTAAEVAQEVFLAAWQGLDDLERPESFGGWVRRIARNRALNRLDRERRSTPDDRQAGAALDRSAPDVDLTAALGEREQRELVWAAASALGERDASLLDLHLRHGFGAGEIAEELGVTTNNAHQLLHRLKGRLGGAIRSWVLWRSGTCPGLDRAVAAAGLSTFGAEAVKVVSRHARDCAECRHSQQLRLAPEALFAAMPMALAPPLLKAEAASALSQAGVPLGAPAPTGAIGAGGEPGGGGTGSGDAGGRAGDGASSGPGEAGGGGDAAAGDGAALGSDARGAPDSAASTDPGLDGTPPDGGGHYVTSRVPSPVDATALGGVAALVQTGPGAAGTSSRRRRQMGLAGIVVLVLLLGVAVLLSRGDGSGDPAETAGAPGEAETRAGVGGLLPTIGLPPTTVATTPAEPDPTAAPDGTAGGTTAPTVTGGAGTGAAGTTGPPDDPDPTEPDTAPEPGQTPPPPEEPPPAESPPVIAGFRAAAPGPWCGATPSAGTGEVVLTWQSSGGDTATLSGPDGTTTEDASGTATRCAASGDTFTLAVTGPGGSATDPVTVP
jgi:RNA polymerase sigma factor (sigma-70 family)